MCSQAKIVRPERMFEEVCHQRELDGFAFYDKYNRLLTDIPCPACSTLGRDAFKKFGFTFQECPECMTLYCSPRPNDELLHRYYNEYAAPRLWTDILIASNEQRAKEQYSPRVMEIINMLDEHGAGGTAVDLGAGSGTFARTLSDSGYFSKVICLEWAESCVEECRRKGLESLQGGLELLHNGSADLVCLNDVIEHVYDPAAVLSQCARVLGKGGFVSIAAPNGQGFDQLVLGSQAANVVPPEHLTFFNPSSMRILFERCGFEAVEITTPGRLDIDIVADEVGKGFKLGEDARFIQTLINSDRATRDAFQTFLASNGLSGHMLCLGRKK